MTPHIGSASKEPADDPLIQCRSLFRSTRPPLAPYTLNAETGDRCVICLVTRDYPPAEGNAMADRFSRLAQTLADEGHHVHALTATQGLPSLDYEDGVWVHRLKIRAFAALIPSSIAPHPIPAPVWDFSRTMLEEVMAVDRRRKVDLIYCPSTNGEPLAFLLDGSFSLIVTTYGAAEPAPGCGSAETADMTPTDSWGSSMVAMEEHILGRAEMIHVVSAGTAKLSPALFASSRARGIRSSTKVSAPGKRETVKTLHDNSWFMLKDGAKSYQGLENIVKLIREFK